MVPESPTGQFLVSILRSHPHLFPAAADQQLERLAADRDAANVSEEESGSGTDLTLYRYYSSAPTMLPFHACISHLLE